MRVADLVAQTLYAHGVRHAFGMPGGEVVTLIDALEKAGIRFVLCRHETAAAIMAAGSSAMTGAPGLLVTTLGPGLTNAVNGIADASQEHVPLIVLSGVVEHGLRGQYTHQILDQSMLLAPLVKASFEIEAERPSATVARAVRLALRAPLGPVHLQLAPDTAAKSASSGETALAPARKLSVRLDPSCEGVSEVATLLFHAKRPLIVTGWEAVQAGASPGVRAIMAEGEIPVLTTYKAKGVVDETQPLALGGAGLSPRADRILSPILCEADVILLVGYDPIEMRSGWINPFAESAQIIEISASPPDHGMHRVDLRITADICNFLAALKTHSLASTEPARQEWSMQCISVRQSLREAFASPKNTFGPHAVFDALQTLLPEKAVLTADSGAHRILLSQHYLARAPLSMLQSAGFCTMGAAVPLAAGVKLVHPDRAVVAVLGDGGLEMCLGELGTLRDQKLPIVIVVLQDESLALIELKQAQAGLARAGVSLGKTKFEEIAKAFGGQAARIDSKEALAIALRRALQAPCFSLIVCDIQARDYAGSF